MNIMNSIWPTEATDRLHAFDALLARADDDEDEEDEDRDDEEDEEDDDDSEHDGDDGYSE